MVWSNLRMVLAIYATFSGPFFSLPHTLSLNIWTRLKRNRNGLFGIWILKTERQTARLREFNDQLFESHLKKVVATRSKARSAATKAEPATSHNDLLDSASLALFIRQLD